MYSTVGLDTVKDRRDHLPLVILILECFERGEGSGVCG